MNRGVVWAIYIVGAISIGYLALYAWATVIRPQAVPDEPIRIFEREDAPRHSLLPRPMMMSSLMVRD